MNSYVILIIKFPNINKATADIIFTAIRPNDNKVTNIVATRYVIFNNVSTTIFLKLNVSYNQPKNPVNLPSFFLLKNVKYSAIPPTIATIKAIIDQIPKTAMLSAAFDTLFRELELYKLEELIKSPPINTIT